MMMMIFGLVSVDKGREVGERVLEGGNVVFIMLERLSERYR